MTSDQMSEYEKRDPVDILPCPLCKSTGYSTNMWSVDDGEVNAIECNDCLCGAPLESWQNRK